MTATNSIVRGQTVARLAVWPVLLLAALALAVHWLTAPRYGYFRDEFYILACARHLDWGYVDHAPLVALVGRLTMATLGTSLNALRFVTGLSAAAKVFLTALVARELGGNALAQSLAALFTLVFPVFLVIDNQFSLNTGDPLFWMGTVLVILIALRTQRLQLLPWAGLIAGLGLENKHSTAFFLVALAFGLLVTPARSLFRERFFQLALVLAFLVFVPNLLWQQRHHFPTLEFLHQVNATHKNVELPPGRFLLAQLMMTGPLNAIVLLPGLYFLLRSRPFRFLGVTYIVLVLILMTLHGKDYYLAPIYPLLLAAGAVFWSVRPRAAIPIAAVLSLAALLVMPALLPILPPDRIAPYMARLGIAPSKTETAQSGPLPQYFGDQFGWPETARDVAAVFHALPAEERAQTAIYTGDYGDAGALELLGQPLGLPRVLSAHNTYWYWGQGAEARTLILVNSERLIRENRCTSITEGPKEDHPYAMTMDHFRIRVCHGLKQPLAGLWPSLKHWE